MEGLRYTPSVNPALPLLLLFALAASPQTPAPALAETLVSPDVHADRTVTFRLFAPKASVVTLTGDWMPLGSAEKMTKDDRGVWSITAGPLSPQIYLYTFKLDGISIADPINPRIKLRARTSASLVEVPGDEPWLYRDVPHGKVEINLHHSAVLGGVPRQVFVYTPPGYGSAATARYPVLYLFHGNNDVAAGWTFTGNANIILDNLIAEKKAIPMLVVMPWGHAVPFGAPREQQARNNDLFERYLIEEVLPLVESNYRTSAGGANRALAGLSMGGAQSLSIGLRHPDLFGNMGIFSAGKPRDFETRFKAALDAPEDTNAKLKLFWIGVGKQDSILDNVRQLRAALEAHKIRHVAVESEGAHFYPVWRRYLTEFAALLFR
jgi:enterochelin esterase-like enzyme